ncbi:GerMN domain-containing protein [Clostridium sp.]|uniref:GerMN domain-containing protein n=1 Tax=Clostridium sp. TaxID=1506 RepID=UPI001A37D547|nr:GerMN domain-containing protein [Clostridium sp.]MBK5240140.1 GerMN domain-containing protein [Clostridium sp.]
MKKILSAILCSVLIFTLSGCERAEVKKDNDSKVIIKETSDEVVEETTEVKDEEIKTKEVVLYFSDDQAMYLVGEKRNIEELTAKAMVLELIKGPSAPSEGAEKLYETLPSDLTLLDVQVKEGIASVDISGNSVKKISGGSTGEGMALYSIINTLILDPNLGITKVQFLVDGKKVDSIKGHYDARVPMSEDSEMIKK